MGVILKEWRVMSGEGNALDGRAKPREGGQIVARPRAVRPTSLKSLYCRGKVLLQRASMPTRHAILHPRSMRVNTREPVADAVGRRYTPMMEDRHAPLPNFLPKTLAGRVLVACGSLALMSEFGYLGIMSALANPRGTVFEKICRAVVVEFLLAAFFVCFLLFLWSIFKSLWIERLLASAVQHVMVFMLLISIGLMAALIYVFTV
jgi:hypothetical protein